MDINAETEVSNASQDRSSLIANVMVESVAELLGHQSAEIVAHINRWSEELVRNIRAIEMGGGQVLPFAADTGREPSTIQAGASVRQMCPLCGCVAFAWCRERAALRCLQCASTGRSRLMGLVIERSGLLKRGISVLDLTPEQGLALRIQPLASCYRRPGPDAGDEPAHIDCAELCAGPPGARLRARFDLLIHTHLVHPGPGAIGSALQNLAACLKDTGHMLFTLPIKGAPASAEGFDGTEVQRLMRRQFGNRLSIVDPRDYLTHQDFEFYRVPSQSSLSSDTIFAISGA